MLRPPFRQISASSAKILSHHEVRFHVVHFVSPQKPRATFNTIRLHRGRNTKSAAAENICGCAFSRLWHHSTPYCCLNQRRRFAFETSGSRTKPDAPPTPCRVPPPERPSVPHWFGSMRRAAIPPFHTVGDPSCFPTRRVSAARRQGPMNRFP